MYPTWNETSWRNTSMDPNGSETFRVDRPEDGLDVGELVIIFIMSSIAIIGFQGNLSVAVVIINNPSLRASMTSLFVLNLVIVDLLACVLAMPLAIVAFSIRNSNYDAQICEISGFSSTSFMLCSMLTLCVISMDRFYSIAMPLHHAAHSAPLIALVVVVVVWLIGIIVASLPFLGLNSYKFKDQERICSFEWAEDKNDRAFVITIFIISFLIPSLVILSMYSSIFCIARKAARTIAPRPSESTLSTVVNPEQEISQTDVSQQNAYSTREIAVATIGVSVERKPRVRTVSFSSDDSKPENSTDNNDRQHGVVISYSSSTKIPLRATKEKPMPKRNRVLRQLVTSSSLPYDIERGCDIFSTSSTQQPTHLSLTNLQSINSQLINCDREDCTRHPSDNNAGRFCCHCLTQRIVNANIEENNIPTSVRDLQSINKTQDRVKLEEDTSSLQNGKSQSRPLETSHQNPKSISFQYPTLFQTQPKPLITPTPQINQPPATPRSKHAKAFRTVMVIVLSYLALWGPYFVCQVHHSLGGSINSSSKLFVSWLGFTSYTVHPFLYGGMNRLIRDELSHLYREIIFSWLQALAYCLCWSCCRCCHCFNATRDIFIPKGDDSNNNSAVASYCMPWLKTEEDDEGDNENEISEAPRGRRRRGENDEELNEEDHTESFFQFLQRTQDEDSHIPASLVMANGPPTT